MFFSPSWLHCPCGSMPPLWDFSITPRHTTLGRTALDELSTRRSGLYLTTLNNHKKQTSMTPAAFEPAIPANERPQTYALDRAATEIGFICIYTRVPGTIHWLISKLLTWVYNSLRYSHQYTTDLHLVPSKNAWSHIYTSPMYLHGTIRTHSAVYLWGTHVCEFKEFCIQDTFMTSGQIKFSLALFQFSQRF